jgi:cobalt-zinc-cadmium efflux system protein
MLLRFLCGRSGIRRAAAKRRNLGLKLKDETHHTHQHGGQGYGHSHTAVAADNERRVFVVMLLTGGYMIVQAVGGVLAGSLALIADAGHMLSDTAALGLAWVAFRVSRRPATQSKTFGWHRFEVLAAFVNGIVLFALAAWISVEAVLRLTEPVQVLGAPMLVVASVGLLVNIVGFLILQRGNTENMNLRGALLHVIGDLLGSVAAIAAALIILWTGWMAADPLLSILVALLILRSAWDLVRRSAHILLEGTPEHVDAAEVRQALREDVPEILDVHHVHVWSLTQERTLMTLHVVVPPTANRDETVRAVNASVHERFGIGHATIQIEGGSGDTPPVQCASDGTDQKCP